MSSTATYTLNQLALLLNLDVVGDGEYSISGLAPLDNAGAEHLAFLANPKYRDALQQSGAGAIILTEDMVAASPAHCLVSANPYLSYAKASQLFAPSLSEKPGIHPSAVVADTAQVDATACIGANVTVGAFARIGANSSLAPGTVIGEGAVIGDDCLLHANVSIYHRVSVGDRAIIHSAAVIGSDGFGFAPAGKDSPQGGWVKIAQLGGVTIGDDVEIGAGTTIDRGALEDTVIGDRVIIDNQVHIAHNVVIGDNTAIAACVGISGSTTIGRNCTIAGASGIAGHLTITDNVFITGMAMVTGSITEPGSYSSGTGLLETRRWRKSAVRFGQLDDMQRRIVKLEKQLQDRDDKTG